MDEILSVCPRRSLCGRNRLLILSAIIVAVLVGAPGGRGDTIELKNGRTVTGRIIRENESIVFLDDGDKVRRIYRKNIASITKDVQADNAGRKDFALRDKEGVALFVPYTTTDAEKAERVVRRIGRELAREVGTELSYVEAGHYLIITNIGAEHALQCAQLLERLYTKVAELFGIPPATHVFVGRLPVFIFVSFEQFQAAAQLLHKYRVNRHIAAYHMTRRPFEPGRQHIIAYGLRDWDSFAYTLVHETAHAFMARYIAERGLPNWVEEGFAEFVAGEVMRPRLPVRPMNDREFEAMLRGGKVDYPRARQVVDLLIRADREKFLRFVAVLKLGEVNAEAALQTAYGFGFEALTQQWRRDTKGR